MNAGGDSISFGDKRLDHETPEGSVFFVRKPDGERLFVRTRRLSLGVRERAVEYDCLSRHKDVGIWRSVFKVMTATEFAGEFQDAVVTPYRVMMGIEWRGFEAALNSLWLLHSYNRIFMPEELSSLVCDLERAGVAVWEDTNSGGSGSAPAESTQ